MADDPSGGRVLFVDDEPKVLSGLQRMLRPMRHAWSMHFAGGGAEALDALAGRPFDIVVTDMRMPGIDGAALLEEISRAYPRAIRIVLSGQADRDAIRRVVGLAHQCLSKPCEGEELTTKLRQLLALRGLVANESLRSRIGALRSLPTAAGLIARLEGEMEGDNPSLGQIGRTVSQDPAMTAKLLQFVNSALFGARRQVWSGAHAVQLLGIDLVRSLLLSSELVSEAEAAAVERFGLEHVWRRSIAIPQFVRVIAALEGLPAETTDHAVTAAALHDAGRLVLAACIPDEYGAVIDRAAHDSRPLPEVELGALGCTTRDACAYLLGLWGLPEPVLAALATPPEPGAADPTASTARLLVQAAAAIAGELVPGPGFGDARPADLDDLAAIGTGVFERWLRECAADLEAA